MLTTRKISKIRLHYDATIKTGIMKKDNIFWLFNYNRRDNCFRPCIFTPIMNNNLITKKSF